MGKLKWKLEKTQCERWMSLQKSAEKQSIKLEWAPAKSIKINLQPQDYKTASAKDLWGTSQNIQLKVAKYYLNAKVAEGYKK